MLNSIIKKFRNLTSVRFKKRPSPHSFVILDANDNSVTLSHHLFKTIKKITPQTSRQPKVFVFYIPQEKAYGFILNPDFEQPTQLADIQYNSKHKCVGFESLNPTVAKILYDYGIPHLKPCKLSVALRMQPEYHYFQILPPKRNPHKSPTPQ